MDADEFGSKMQDLAIDIKKRNFSFKYNRIHAKSLSFQDIYDTIVEELKKRGYNGR